jgi:hypothetical protein
MTDERDKPSRIEKSSARTTARDVPFVRDAGSDAEPAPRGQRPEQLPRDPTYEAELAQVELAVLRNPERRDDPSTKQGGRRGYQGATLEPPESVTPESPGTRAGREALQSKSPSPPSSSGRSAASGTLLSVGGVDPRAKTERTLETPRMYFSQADATGEVYFKPGKIPAVTVHQTLETETVKLADSIDPRRAKTLPRIDRQALARYVESERAQESAAPNVLAGPQDSEDFAGEPESLPFGPASDYDAASSLHHAEEGQIHASLSPFRDQAEPSYTFDDGVPTRAEPLAARRGTDAPPSLGPDPSTVPTQRDLPAHRIAASLPPPPSVASVSEPTPAIPTLHAVATTSAPTVDDEPVELDERVIRKPVWRTVAAFGAALLLTFGLGLWLTRSPASSPAAPLPAASPAGQAETQGDPRGNAALPAPSPVPSAAIAVSAPEPEPALSSAPLESPSPPKTAAPAAPKPVVPAPSSRKPVTPKVVRETIF